MLQHIIGVLAVLLVLVVATVTSIVFILMRRRRRLGVILLGITVLLGLAAGWKIFYAHSFNKTYHTSSAINLSALRARANAANIYLGATADVNMLADPRFLTAFNSVTPENALKLGELLSGGKIGAYDFSKADAIVDRAINQGLRVRGHTLIWGKASDLFKSPDLEAYLQGFPAAQRPRVLRQVVEQHIDTVVSHYRGRISMWDVVNEPLYLFWSPRIDENVFYRYLGPDYIADMFRMARKANPEAKLYLNEQLGSFGDARAEAFFALTSKLRKSGAPIDGAGLQSHFGFAVPSIKEFQDYLSRITALGVEVEITEMDARLALFGDAPDPYVAQAEFYGKILDACLQNPNCKGVTFWGFTDAHCWMDSLPLLYAKPNEPYLFDEQGLPKPVVEVLDEVLRNHSGRKAN